MAKSSARRAPRRPARQAARSANQAASPFDISRFELVHQVGGIRTGTLDAPQLGVGGQSCRVAFVDTGAGLRFTVALDRGGDIVDAAFNNASLAYLSPVGLVPPREAHHLGLNWLRGWAGGLLTTCGPQHIGGPREEDGQPIALHGHYSNSPAAVEMLINPDPHRGVHDMLLSLIVRDSRMFGPTLEVRRLIRCRLGEPAIQITDEVINRGNASAPHSYLYHVNLGYPLLDRGARVVLRGRAEYWQVPAEPGDRILRRIGAAAMNQVKRIAAPLAAHAGAGERGLIVEVPNGRDGRAHVGLINERLKLGVELSFPAQQLPRVANWQHLGPAGSYVCGLEPFSGTLMGKAVDQHPQAGQRLEPGERRRYELSLRVLTKPAALRELASHDGAVTE